MEEKEFKIVGVCDICQQSIYCLCDNIDDCTDSYDHMRPYYFKTLKKFVNVCSHRCYYKFDHMRRRIEDQIINTMLEQLKKTN